jgi:hypothetical protein
MELAKDVSQVTLHRPVTDAQLNGDGLIRKTFSDQLEHIHFTLGQWFYRYPISKYA